MYVAQVSSNRSIVSQDSYDKIKLKYKTAKRYVLLASSAQLTFASILFTLGLYNLINHYDTLLMWFAAPFQLISSALGLLTCHLGKQTRGMCKAVQAFTGIAMVLAELGYRSGISGRDNQMPTWVHTFMLFTSAYINLLLFVACAYYFESIKNVLKVRVRSDENETENIED